MLNHPPSAAVPKTLILSSAITSPKTAARNDQRLSETGHREGIVLRPIALGESRVLLRGPSQTAQTNARDGSVSAQTYHRLSRAPRPRYDQFRAWNRVYRSILNFMPLAGACSRRQLAPARSNHSRRNTHFLTHTFSLNVAFSSFPAHEASCAPLSQDDLLNWGNSEPAHVCLSRLRRNHRKCEPFSA